MNTWPSENRQMSSQTSTESGLKVKSRLKAPELESEERAVSEPVSTSVDRSTDLAGGVKSSVSPPQPEA